MSDITAARWAAYCYFACAVTFGICLCALLVPVAGGRVPTWLLPAAIVLSVVLFGLAVRFETPGGDE